MHHNQFFKEFVAKYQKGLSRALQVVLNSTQSSEESDAGGANQSPINSPTKLTSSPTKLTKNNLLASDAAGQKSKSVQPKKNKPVNYGKQLMVHVNNTNQYRKQLPGVFSKDNNQSMSTLLTEKVKCLQPVSMPVSVMRVEQHERTIALSQSPKGNRSQRSLDAREIEAEIARSAAGVGFG